MVDYLFYIDGHNTLMVVYLSYVMVFYILYIDGHKGPFKKYVRIFFSQNDPFLSQGVTLNWTLSLKVCHIYTPPPFPDKN